MNHIRKLPDGRTIDLAALVKHYQELEGLGGWTITFEWVLDLPIWGQCQPIAPARRAHIKVRDPLSTSQLGGIYKDIVWEIRDTVAHELMHCWTSFFETREPAAVNYEENMVWSLSGAIIKSEGTDDQIIMKSALRSLRPTLRARIASQQSPKGKHRMALSAEQIKAALDSLSAEDADGPAGQALKEILASLMGGGGQDNGPQSDAMPKDQNNAPPGTEENGGAGERQPMARGGNRSRNVTPTDPHIARHKAAADSAHHDSLRLKIHAARTVDGLKIPGEVETAIMACPTMAEADRLLTTARAMAKLSPQRGESGAEPGANNGGESEEEPPKGRELAPRLKARLEARGRKDLVSRGRSTVPRKPASEPGKGK